MIPERLFLDFGLRAAVASQVKYAVRQLMITILTNEQLHAEVVAAGEFHFRQAFLKDMGPAFANDRLRCGDLADTVWRFARAQWQTRHPDLSPAQWLDNYAPPSPMTEQEINDAWEIEIASSESAMGQMYEGSRRIRKGNDLGSKRRN